ncbi:amidohydrolase family protein [Embleya sp. AB8]|uniref:amidohydrolase family protein n=1 Tax=Embleya sp. AB8 TaxID=3156304 RepID=UPI003C72FDB3
MRQDTERSAEHADPIALVDCVVVDGTGAPPLRHGVVVLEAGRIAAVGPLGSVHIPERARVLRCDGRTALPGIIDSHTHIERDIPHVLRAFLHDGVTSVGNTGCGPDLVARLHDAGQAPDAARVFAAGPAVTAPGGYPVIRGDGSAARGVASVAEAEAAVDELVALGVDFVKMAQEPFDFDFHTPGHLPVLAPAVFTAAVRRAAGHGLLVRSHVHNVTQLDLALDAGVTSVEHLIFPLPPDVGYVELYRDGTLGPDALPGLRRRLARMVDQGVYLVPTIGNELANIHAGLPNFPANGLRAVAELMVHILARYVDAGGRVALGSDWVGRPGFPMGMPRRELRYLRAAGMTPSQIIEASTRHAAIVCGRGDTVGVLAPGRAADVIVVDGDPLTDLAALDHVQVVIKDGRLVRADDAIPTPPRPPVPVEPPR